MRSIGERKDVKSMQAVLEKVVRGLNKEEKVHRCGDCTCEAVNERR